MLSTSPNFVLEPKSCLYNIAVAVIPPVLAPDNVKVAPDIAAVSFTHLTLPTTPYV